MSHPSLPMPSRIAGYCRRCGAVPGGAHGLDAVHESFLIRPDILFVDHGTHQGRRGVADADDIRAGLDLRPGKSQLHVQDKGEEVLHEHGIFDKIHHERVDAAQVRSFRAGTFHPAFDQQFTADLFPEQRSRLDPVVHAAPAERVRKFQSGKFRFVRKQRIALADGWRLVVVKGDVRAAVRASRAGSEIQDT